MMSWRSNSLRGGMPFSGGRGMGEAVPDYNAMIQQLLAQITGTAQGQVLPATVPALDLAALASSALDNPATQQLLDNTLNSLLADPVLRAKFEERALGVLWDRYKGVIILGGAGLALLIYLAMRNNSNESRGQR